MEQVSGTRQCQSLLEAEQYFVFFWKKDSCFCQWYHSEFKAEGQTYHCTEQYMMHQKALICKDNETALKILKCKDPAQIKRLGRSVRNWNLYGQIWEDSCYEVVKRGNMFKFTQNQDLKAELLATEGKELVEASPLDNKWGIGLAKENFLAWNKSTWQGRNLLGRVLTEVREALKL